MGLAENHDRIYGYLNRENSDKNHMGSGGNTQGTAEDSQKAHQKWDPKNVSLRNKDRTFQKPRLHQLAQLKCECDILSSYFSTIDWPTIPFPHRHVAAVAVRRFGGSRLTSMRFSCRGKLIRSDKHHGLMEGTLGAYQIV